VLASNRVAFERLNILVVSSFDGTDASAIADFLFAFNAHSGHRVSYTFDPRRLGDDSTLPPST
jgi:hypothetical protein